MVRLFLFAKKRYVGAKCILFWRYSRIVFFVCHVVFHKVKSCVGGDREYIYINMRRIGGEWCMCCFFV